jgi:hypothetical protein
MRNAITNATLLPVAIFLMVAGSVAGTALFAFCPTCRTDSTALRVINEGFVAFLVGLFTLYRWRRTRPRPSTLGLLVAEAVGPLFAAAVVLAANSGVRFPSIDGLYGLLLAVGCALVRIASSENPSRWRPD